MSYIRMRHVSPARLSNVSLRPSHVPHANHKDEYEDEWRRVCVCACVCVCVCMCVCIYVYTYIYIYTYVQIHINTYIYIRIYLNFPAHFALHIYTYMNTHINIHVNIYMWRVHFPFLLFFKPQFPYLIQAGHSPVYLLSHCIYIHWICMYICI